VRIKLTVLFGACAALAIAAATHAAPIPVAQYDFTTKADVGAFQNASAGKCTRKWRQTAARPKEQKDGKQGTTMGGAMAVTVSSGSACVLRTSVVADSSDVAPDQIVTATVSAGRGDSAKAQKNAFQGLVVRQNESSGYELRVFSGAQQWQVLRDPKGTAPVAEIAAGSGKFIRAGTKPNTISLRAFDFGGTQTNLVAAINGKNVVSTTDSATDQPDGRRNGITVGVKGTGAGTGVVGVFDEVTIQVPNPF
jgi:hypothetical protein